MSLGVRGSAGPGNGDSELTAVFPGEDNGRVIISPTKLPCLNLDTRTAGKLGILRSTTGSADDSFGLGHRSRGGLKTLDNGINNIAIHARDTATPTLVPEIDITEVRYVPRYPIGKG